MKMPWTILLLVALGWSIPAAAQFKTDKSAGGGIAAQSVQRWRIGVIVTGTGGSFKRITATTSAPMDWPEQHVRIVAEDLSPDVHVTYQMVDEGARQMTIAIAGLGPGDEAKGLVTFEIQRTIIRPPADTDQYVLADPHRLDRKVAAYLTPSPYIESDHPEIVALARQIGTDQTVPWNHIEVIYDWVRQKIHYQDVPLKGALKGLHDETGDCQELSCLFIAICRAAKIPARTVRVPAHCYAEFYLLDGQGVGHWFPCQPAGAAAFGGIAELRPILQKGDKVLGIVPGTNRKERVRFLPDALTGIPAGGKPEPPRAKFVCEQVKE